jgi:hypothetical protein
MRCLSNTPIMACLLIGLFAMALASPCRAGAQATPAASPGDASIAKAVGTIKSLQADSITIAAESGGDVTAKLTGSTKILRVPPGEKDLKNATALQVQDLQPGDRVLIRGQSSGDPHTIAALAVIVMKQADLSAQHDREREDWQKRGVDGLVDKVDAATGTITISSSGLGAKRSIAVHVGKDTVLRRYAPDSVKFDDAKPAPLDQIKAGDQLRARGTRTPDSSELTAEEIVWGTFRNIAGTITAIDAATNSVTVRDVIAKAPVVVRISSDSQIKKLPPEVAQRFAARLKGGAGGASDEQHASPQNAPTQPASAQGLPQTGGGAPRAPDSQSPRRPGGGPGGNGPPDLQRLLSRLPNSKLADLQKGDAVVILSTEGGDTGTVTAIQLVAGVEPILTAAPTRSLLSPWSLNTSGGEGDSAP